MSKINILVENGAYHLLNVGDVAMLQVALSRLKYLYPQASIQVLTTNPKKLLELFPDVQPLTIEGRNIWFAPLLQRFYKLIAKEKTTSIGLKIEEWLRSHFPSIVYRFLSIKFRKRPDLLQEVQHFVNALYKADLVIATGGGYITDAFKQDTVPKLTTLQLAALLRKPTALFGQGLGPIKDNNFLEKTKNTLVLANLIALREKQVGVALLQALSIPQEKVVITGDDAIELAYNHRNQELGNGIGVNLRIAQYSDISQIPLENVRSALHSVAKKYNAPLLPTPIDHLFYEGYAEPDSVTIQKLLQGYDDTSDGGKTLDTPLKVIEQVGRCRVVVTGSYHAGVFALSQGIPVIGLAKSQYYKDKFFGLADQFGCGCEIILLDDKQLEEKLVASIHHAWQSAEQLRPQLLEAAQLQIALANSAYKKVYELVQSR